MLNCFVHTYLHLLKRYIGWCWPPRVVIAKWNVAKEESRPEIIEYRNNLILFYISITKIVRVLWLTGWVLCTLSVIHVYLYRIDNMW